MGIFSRKKTTTVSTSTSHLIEIIGDPLKDAILVAILEGSSIPINIMQTLMNGMGVKARRAQNYARDSYTLGLPYGSTLPIGNISNEDLAVIIATDIGHADGVIVEENVYTTLFPGLVILPILLSTRGYDPETNEISIFPGDVEWTPWCTDWQNVGGEEDDWQCQAQSTPAEIEAADKKMSISSIDYVEDLVFNPETGLDELVTNLGFVNVTYSQWILRVDGTYYSTIVAYRLDDIQYIETIAVPNYEDQNMGATIVFAGYKKLDAGGLPTGDKLYWVYEVDSGVYPDLNLDPELQENDEFLPVVPIRYNNVDYTDVSRDDPENPLDLWSTSKRLLNIWGFDFEYMGGLLNENPDIDEIDHAYIMWGADIQSDVSSTLLYLVNFFDKMFQTQTQSKLDYFSDLGNVSLFTRPQNTYTTNVPGASGSSDFGESGLDLDILYNYITVTTVVGKIDNGKIGNARKSYEAYQVLVAHEERDYYNSDEGETPYVTIYEWEQRYKLILEAQMTTRLLKRVVVNGLTLTNNIYDGYTVETTLEDVVGNPENHSLMLPLEFYTVQDMWLRHRNELYQDCSLMVINTWQVTKAKWYQSGWFKFLIIVIVIIIAVITWQYQLVPLYLAAAAKGTAAVLMLILKVIIVSVVINYAMQWLVKVIGPKLGIIGAIILAIVALIVSRGASIGSFMMVTAQYMLQFAAALISAVNEFLIDKAEDIINEYIEFMSELEDKYEDLKLLTDLLENKSDLNPLMFAKPYRLKTVPNESPDQFYQRCLGLCENTFYVKSHEITNFASTRLSLDRNISKEMYSLNART